MYELIGKKELISTDTTVAIANGANYKMSKSMSDLVTHESISLFGAQVFFRLVETFPSLIRVWYVNCIGKRAIKHISAFIKTKVCPIVIEQELEKITNNTKTSMPDHVRVKVIKGRNQIIATYEQDEVQLDIILNIPPDYPLKSLKIESSKRLGVSEMQWRKWTLKMTTVLFSHEGKLWDAIMLWKQNLDRHFEGVEACPICYSIVHIHDHALPKIKCKVCRSKYHGACLYKWFTTSGQSSCPTCRSTSSFL
jgi:ribosomal protein L31E